MQRIERLDIQSKIILVLVAVIVPTFLLVTYIENKLTRPILEEEMKQIGVTTAESLSTKMLSHHWLSNPNASQLIESEIQTLLYFQPSILRMDVYVRDEVSQNWKVIASNVEDSTRIFSPADPLDSISSQLVTDDEGLSYWDIHFPILPPSYSKRHAGKELGIINVWVSTRTVTRVLDTFWKVTFAASAVSIVILILVLTYFLRRAVMNERLLRLAENENLQLSQKLQEAQREVMNNEKLAVMGQLTANFAHEIGTPLNAIGGHLQLLNQEVSSGVARKEPPGPRALERLDIISGELMRIEDIVKGFLQTTSKPRSQPQLTDLNALVVKTADIVRPRTDALGMEINLALDRKMGPLKVVPVDIEQILLNLVNNSLDSLHTKQKNSPRSHPVLKISTRLIHETAQDWAEISVYDSGVGIKREDLRNVVKPFFTTKGPGEGTGLGLTICHQLANKYGGVLEIDSRAGAWASFTLKLPYRVAA